MTALLALIAAFAAFAILRHVIGALDIPLSKITDNPSPVVAAVIGVCGVFVSVLGGLLVWRMQESARRAGEARARQRKLDETLEALDAMMQLDVRSLRQSFDPDKSEARLKQYRTLVSQASGGLPAGIAADPNILMDLARPALLELPGVVSGALAQYQSLDRQLNKAVTALSEGVYRDVSADRRRQVLVAYHLLGEHTLVTALYAQAALRLHRRSRADGVAGEVTALSVRKALARRDRKLICALLTVRVRAETLKAALSGADASDQRPDGSGHDVLQMVQA